jgi:glycosyltransferase involved in cell wall biosynthesis
MKNGVIISAVILTKNEEGNIERCLRSLEFCSEIIVVDDHSVDKTVKLAKRHGAIVYQRLLSGDFSKQRNFGLKKAKGKWILFVDADERISKILRNEIKKNVGEDKGLNGFYFRRHDYFLGKRLKYGEIGSLRLLRLAKKGSGEWKRAVHEVWDIAGSVGELTNPIIHYPHQSLGEFIDHIKQFSSRHAEEHYQEKKKSSLFKIIFWPLLKFIRNYFFRLGFLDGGIGFVYSMMMSLHSYLAWGKLWVKQRD